MNVFVTSDSNWESKIDHVHKVLDLRQVFEPRDYGPSLTGLSVVIVCRDPELKFKRRIRFSKRDRCLSLDIILHLPDTTPLNHRQRRSVVAQRLLAEVPHLLRSYRLSDFDYAAFEADWTESVTEQLLGPDADRFDHLSKPQATS